MRKERQDALNQVEQRVLALKRIKLRGAEVDHSCRRRCAVCRGDFCA